MAKIKGKRSLRGVDSKTHTWRVCTLDVWGNEEDGWEVNDVFTAGYVEIPEDAGQKEIWKILCDEGYAKGPFSEAEFDNNTDTEFTQYINEKKTGEPVFQLLREDS